MKQEIYIRNELINGSWSWKTIEMEFSNNEDFRIFKERLKLINEFLERKLKNDRD